MKYKVLSQLRNVENPPIVEIARFEEKGMALWAATIFTSHKIFGRDHLYWVQNGKKSFIPCAAINPDDFSLFIPKDALAQMIQKFISKEE